MKNNTYKYSLAVLMIGLSMIGIGGCYEVPNFPDTPTIAFQKVEYYQTNTGFDSLLISVDFEDGNGDLGLDDRHSGIQAFRDGDYLFQSEDNTITVDEWVTPRDAGRNISEFFGYPLSDNIASSGITSIPPYEPPYSCTHWQITPNIDGIEVPDTVFFIPNEDRYNIFIEFLYKDNAGDEFKEFDWVSSDELQGCGTPIDARFPVLETDNVAIKGTLKYGFVSSGLRILFINRILKLRIQIQDRALNKSNVVETGEFTLREIQIN